MATKQEYVQDALCLFDSQLSPLHDLLALERELTDVLPLNQYLKTCNSRLFKLFGECLDILNQDIPQEVVEEISVLQESISNLPHKYQGKQADLAKQLAQAAPGSSIFQEIVTELGRMDVEQLAESQDIKGKIAKLQSHNLAQAHSHILSHIAPKRKSSKNGANGEKKSGLPNFTFPNTYHVRGYGLDLTLTLNNETDWVLEGQNLESGDAIRVSDKDTTHTLSSWTMLGKVMRILSDDYEQDSDDPFTVGKGDLKSDRLGDVNAGGTGRLMVKNTTPEKNQYPTDTD